MVAINVSDTTVSTTTATVSKVTTTVDPNVVSKGLSDKILTQKLEDLQSNIDTLTTLCTILCVILLFFFVIQALAVVIQLIRRCGQKKMENEMAKRSEKSDKSSKKTKSSKKSKKGKSKKSKSKKSKTNSSKSKTSKKSAEKKKKQQPPKLPSSKLSAAEKKPENSGSKKLEASGGGGKKSSAEQQPLPPSLIQHQPQDPLLSLSNGNVSSEKPTTAQIEKEFKYMNNLEAGKLQTLPLPSVIAAAIDPAKHVPEAITPSQPSKTADSMKDNKIDETSASLKYEKQFPDVTTPPQVRSPKKNEKDEVKIDGMPSGSESVRKVADVSSPPPLIPESKSNTDSLMLPVSTPPMTPVQLGSLQVSTPPLAPPISPQQPTTSVQSGSLQPLPTIPKAPINKLDDPQTKN